MAMNGDPSTTPPDAHSDDGDTRLACGRWMDEVWQNLGQSPTSHERSCEHCRAARSSLAPLREATSQLTRSEVDDPSLRTPVSVISNVLDLARTEIRRGRRLPLVVDRHDDDDPVLTITEQAVVSVIWRVGDATDEVQARRCRIDLRPSDDEPAAPGPEAAALTATSGRGAPSVVVVTVEVSVAVGSAIGPTLERLRRAIRAAITAEVGLVVAAVDVVVEDLHEREEHR
jgi:hypothetical protein